MSCKVSFYFHVKQVQDLPGYPHGSAFMHKLTVETQYPPQTLEEAKSLFLAHRDQFLEELKRESISCRWQYIEGRTLFIPTCYLNCPKYIEVEGEFSLLTFDPVERAESIRRSQLSPEY